MPAGKVFNTLYFLSNVLLFESLFPFYTGINFLVFISPIYLHISHRLHTDTMKASCRLFCETEIDCMHTLVIFQFFYFFYNVKKSVHKQMHMLHMPLWLLEEVKRLPNELTGFGRLFNLFHAFSLFLYPLKTSRIYVFRGGGIKRPAAWNGLTAEQSWQWGCQITDIKWRQKDVIIIDPEEQVVGSEKMLALSLALKYLF